MFFQAAVEIAPHYIDGYYNIGVLYSEQERLEEAIRAFQMAIEINPSFAPAYYNLGCLYADHDRTSS